MLLILIRGASDEYPQHKCYGERRKSEYLDYITKTRLFKYTENFTTKKKMKIFR